mgnify:CR=1 FL=1|tara:strand:- start:3648 stop:4040 length:393 start_codon:yes stop_codon:yes gene_type:complete
MASRLSFKDININFKKHPVTNDLVVSRDASAVKQAIINLLLTNKGERLFQPDYGSDIRSQLFEPLDFATCAVIKNSILYTLNTFEPRIAVSKLDVKPNFQDNGFMVTMEYGITGSDVLPTNIEFFLARTR